MGADRATYNPHGPLKWKNVSAIPHENKASKKLHCVTQLFLFPGPLLTLPLGFSRRARSNKVLSILCD